MIEFGTLQDLVLAAHEKLPASVWDFVIGGAESETTLKRNRHALDCLGFQARTFTDVTQIDVSTKILGHHCTLPVMLAPMGSISLVDSNGALAAAQAAAAYGLISFMSSVADPGPEALAKAANCPLVYTLYVQGDNRWIEQEIKRACELGFTAIAVLADTAYYSRRDRDVMNQLASKVDPATTYATVQRTMRLDSTRNHPLPASLYPATVTWKTLERIKDLSSVPVIAKGISCAASAKLALDHGADALYVSNHGGRQLDHQLATADMLVEVVDVVGPGVEIFVDGGCMRGADIVKFLALGATAVGIGKLQALALAAGGTRALERALSILEEELVVDMGLIGVTSTNRISSECLRSVSPVNSLHPLAPFPVVMERLGLR